MGLRSKEEYIKGLRDGREVYFRGERVKDVTAHPVLKVAVEHTALEFECAEDPKHRDLVTFVPNGAEERYSRYFKLPETSEDLLRRMEMIQLGTRLGGVAPCLIKEIGTDGLFALNIVTKRMDERLKTGYFERVLAYHDHCMKNDLAMAVAQTDVKGDRSLSPSEQEHPDYYVRIVEETKDGIVVRGAKAHTTFSICADEILVIPTRTLSEKDKAYAVAFAVPAGTKGLKMIASPFGATSDSQFHHPVSTRHHPVETLTIFDDVFVPWERVFMKGESPFAGPLALTFVQFHRFTAIAYKAPLLDLLVGMAELMAECNGIRQASHVREKIIKLIMYSQTVQALTKAAAHECKLADGRVAVPDPVITNIAKYFFAANYHQHASYVQDIAGGLLVTGPSEEDLKSPETSDYVRRYCGGKKGISAEDRLRVFNLIRDITASDFGGYHEILAIHAEGSLEAQKLTILREYDTRPCIEFAKTLANVESILL